MSSTVARVLGLLAHFSSATSEDDGEPLPLHGTASGSAVLAFGGPSFVDRVLSGALHATIVRAGRTATTSVSEELGGKVPASVSRGTTRSE